MSVRIHSFVYPQIFFLSASHPWRHCTPSVSLPLGVSRHPFHKSCRLPVTTPVWSIGLIPYKKRTECQFFRQNLSSEALWNFFVSFWLVLPFFWGGGEGLLLFLFLSDYGWWRWEYRTHLPLVRCQRIFGGSICSLVSDGVRVLRNSLVEQKHAK